MANSRTALVLNGGGARAAYQVGVLLAIRELLGRRSAANPFPILCGTSAGAINAAALACHADDFGAAVATLATVWRGMRAGDIYRADLPGISAAGGRWLSALAFGWAFRRSPRSLFDNEPLRRLLEARLDMSGIARSLASGALFAVSITASGYASGDSVSFFQAHPEVGRWRRAQRVGCQAELTVDHLMASSAIPFIFPAVYLNREYFGDGSMRQLAPLSPAVHLGAEKVLVVALGQPSSGTQRQSSRNYPTLAQIAGHALSSIFIDTLSMDVERMERINTTLSHIPDEVRSSRDFGLRPLQALIITPSERLDDLAARYAHTLPFAVRGLLRMIGAMNRRGGALTSYLLFERPFTEALIDLGYRDTMARREDVGSFLSS